MFHLYIYLFYPNKSRLLWGIPTVRHIRDQPEAIIQ